eukprot:COSAG04_NODE_695_length_11066_cov_14.905352_7_plen_80_part_00
MVVVRLETPTEPPKWAVLEREMIQALSDACEEFFREPWRTPTPPHPTTPLTPATQQLHRPDPPPTPRPPVSPRFASAAQ